MKVVALLLMLTITQVFAAGAYSQNVRISLGLNRTKVADVLNEIERKTEFKFFYNNKLINVDREVDLNVENKDIYSILDQLFEDTDVDYVVKNKHIILSNQLANAQEQQAKNLFKVKGHITDTENAPIVGVTVVVKGTTNGTVTNINGEYSLPNISENSILQFSFVGMTTVEKMVGSNTVIDVVMQEDAIGLDEIVAVGYGTIKKRDLTGAIATVDQQRLTDIPATNLTSTLQGAVAGVSISTPYGAPGSGSSVLIRGLNSITASNTPLVVVDGIPGGAIDDVNPNDIKSIEILKDAASTSIYGSRATNGVILITTKSGVKGKTSVSYSGYYGFASVARKVDIMDVDEYISKRREMYRMTNELSQESANDLNVETILGSGNELDMYNLGKSYNWQEELFQQAPMQSHGLSINGGDEKTQYYFSVNWLDQTGLIKNTGFDRKSVRTNISTKATDWLTIGTNLFATQSSQQNVQDAIFSAAFQISPLGKMYNDEELKDKYTLYPMSPDNYIANPFTDIEMKDHRDRTRVMNSTFIELNFLKHFKYKASLNSIYDFYNNKFFTPFYTKTVEAFDKYESASITRDQNRLINVEHMLSYNQNFGDHVVGATAVFATESYRGEGLWAYAKDFGTDYYGWTALELGNVDYRNLSSSEENTFLESMVGRLNYSYKGKYLAQFTIRRDRSSKFAPDNRDAIFPGASLGWRISDEPFMAQQNFIDNLKLRVSYAMTGNQGIGYRAIYNEGRKIYYTTGQDVSGQIIEGLVQSTLANKDLKWEKSAQSNIGLDFSLYKGRFSGVIEAYKTQTSDLLLNRSISAITGFTSMLTNIGGVENQGIEIALNSIAVNRKDFKWNISANFTTNKNKITELYGDGLDDYSNLWFIGKPIGVVYDYVFDGIMQNGETAPAYMDNTVGSADDGINILPGEAKVKDIGGWETLEDGSLIRTKTPDGKIDEADKTIIGQTQPKWFANLGMQFQYKNFDASFNINHVNGTMRQIPGKIGDRTQSLDIPYYTDESPNTQYGRPAWPSKIEGIARTGNQYGYLSYYQSGTYTRLQDVTLGYTFPRKTLDEFGISMLRLYITGQNLLTLTEFIGYDPSLQYNGNQTSASIDRLHGYPTTRTFIFGLKINF